MKAIYNCVGLFSLLLLSACGEKEIEPTIDESITLERIQRVSVDNNFLNDNTAVTIRTGPTRKNIVDITLYQENIIDKYAVLSLANNEPSISIEATWNDVTYIQSVQHNTNVNLTIKTLDSDNLLASIMLSGNLVNPDTGSFLQINESKLEIGGLQFNILTTGKE